MGGEGGLRWWVERVGFEEWVGRECSIFDNCDDDDDDDDDDGGVAATYL